MTISHLSNPDRQDITALVLCGGAGERMGGHDKPLMQYRAKPMIEHIVVCARKCTDRVLVSANRNKGIYEQYGTVVADAGGTGGPLAGVLAGLSVTDTAWIWVIPGDAPDISSEVLEALWRQRRDAAAIVAHDGERRQVLHLLLHASVRPHLEHYLEEGGYAVYAWLESLPSAQLEEVDCRAIAPAFANINYPGQLREESSPQSG